MLRPPPLSTLFPYTTLFRSTVLVTSEAEGAPIERAFDGTRGPGASRWRAGTPGEQSITLAFDEPQTVGRSEEHTSELQSQSNLVCRLLLEKKNEGEPGRGGG